MEVLSLTYSKLFNLGNYEHEEIEINLLIRDQTPEQALAEARAWVNAQHDPESPLARAKRELHSVRDVLDAADVPTLTHNGMPLTLPERIEFLITTTEPEDAGEDDDDGFVTHDIRLAQLHNALAHIDDDPTP